MVEHYMYWLDQKAQDGRAVACAWCDTEIIVSIGQVTPSDPSEISPAAEPALGICLDCLRSEYGLLTA